MLSVFQIILPVWAYYIADVFHEPGLNEWGERGLARGDNEGRSALEEQRRQGEENRKTGEENRRAVVIGGGSTDQCLPHFDGSLSLSHSDVLLWGS